MKCHRRCGLKGGRVVVESLTDDLEKLFARNGLTRAATELIDCLAGGGPRRGDLISNLGTQRRLFLEFLRCGFGFTVCFIDADCESLEEPEVVCVSKSCAKSVKFLQAEELIDELL
ncbi:hypothetical protein AXH82_02240 [Microbacterium sp. PAMC 28756]|nr:hypothetical protein AXH82_02240 [Microbacterium sp. PAMC 28756]